MPVASQKLKIRKKEVNSGFDLVKLESCVTPALETGVTSNVQANQVISAIKRAQPKREDLPHSTNGTKFVRQN